MPVLKYLALRLQEVEQLSVSRSLSELWVCGSHPGNLWYTSKWVGESGRPKRGLDGVCREPQPKEPVSRGCWGAPAFYTSVPSPPWAHLSLPPSVPFSKNSLTPSLLARLGGL